MVYLRDFSVFVVLGFLAIFLASERYRSVDTAWNLNIVSNGEMRAYSLNSIDKSGVKGSFQITGSFTFEGNGSEKVNIIPDDCLRLLKINSKIIEPLAGENWCDYKSGFSRQANQLFINGLNQIDAEIENFNGDRKLHFNFSKQKGIYQNICLIFLYSVCLLWTCLLSKSLKLNKTSIYLLLLYSLISSVYLYLTPPHVRQYDVFERGGHADFIKYVAENWRLPEIGTGWEYHQPPLYYIFSAVILKIYSCFNEKIHWEIFQASNWLAFQLFIATGLKVLSSILNGKSFLFAAFLFALWPMNSMHAARIGNDNLLYLFCACAIFFITRWLKLPDTKNILLACFFATLAVFTKNTGLILLAVIAVIVFLMLLFELLKLNSALLPKVNDRFSIKSAILVLLLSALMASLSLLPKVTSYFSKENHEFLFPGVNANRSLLIPVNFSTFIPNPFAEALTKPFVSSRKDSTGRKNFWVYFFKTSLTGELFPSQSYLKSAGNIYLWSAFILLSLFLSGLAISYTTKEICFIPFVTTFFFSILLLILAVIAKNHSCNQDFRYVYFLLIPVTACIGKAYSYVKLKYSRVFAVSALLLFVISGNFLVVRIAFH